MGTVRLRRICSTDNFFETRSSELESYLMKRGYRRRFIKQQIIRAKQVPPNKPLRVVFREKSGKMLKISTEGGQQNKLILTS